MGDVWSFDPEDLKSALGMCMREASLQRLYKGAPEGAKRALKILFCAAVHPEKVGSEGIWGYLKSVEGDLAKEDLEYLIENWEGQELQDYFRRLLDGINGHKPKLGIRRNRTGVEAEVDLNAEAMKRRMAMEEEEALAQAEAASLSLRKARRDAIIRNAVVIVIFSVLAVGGGIWFMSWKKERAARLEAHRIQIEEMRAEEQRKTEAENEQKRLAREAAEAERNKMLQEREARSKAEREARKLRTQEREKEEENRRLWREKFRMADAALRSAKILLWKSLPKAERPGTVDGIFTCVLPDGNGKRRYYEVQSASDGKIKVFHITGDSAPEELEFKDWMVSLQKHGGIVSNGKAVYLFMQKVDDEAIMLPNGTVFPAELRLGELHGLVRSLNMDVNSLVFKTKVQLKSMKKTLEFEPVDFSGSIPRWKIVSRIGEDVRSAVKKPKPRSIRRTVMMYDGRVVKKQMNGVILVPKNPIVTDGNYYNLREEALRQESECGKIPQEAIERYEREVEQKIALAEKEATLVVSVGSQE